MKTLVLLVALVATGTAQAAMLCARPRSDGTFSTTVKLREACKGNEVEIGIVSLQPLRLFGPTTTSTSSTTSTTLPTCPSGGRRVGGVCWYLANTSAQNCNDVCAGVGLTYDDATRTFAGSAGTLANCEAIFDTGGVITVFATDETSCSTARGCAHVPQDGYIDVRRCVSPATTAGATGDTAHRACACS
jgi:hypothetical protein